MSKPREWSVKLHASNGHGGGTGYYYFATDWDLARENAPKTVIELPEGAVILTREMLGKIGSVVASEFIHKLKPWIEGDGPLKIDVTEILEREIFGKAE